MSAEDDAARLTMAVLLKAQASLQAERRAADYGGNDSPYYRQTVMPDPETVAEALRQNPDLQAWLGEADER